MTEEPAFEATGMSRALTKSLGSLAVPKEPLPTSRTAVEVLMGEGIPLRARLRAVEISPASFGESETSHERKWSLRFAS